MSGTVKKMNEPTRIVKLVYQSYLPFQGRYPRISDQAGILRDAGFQVTILACDREEEAPVRETIDGINITRLRVRTGEQRGPAQSLALGRFFLKALQWFRRRRVDVIICHNLDVLVLGWLVARLKRAALIFDAHEPNYYALWPRRLKPLVRIIDQADQFLACRCAAVTVTNDYQVTKYRQAGVRRVALIGNYTRPALRPPTFEEDRFLTGPVVFGRFGTFYQEVGLEPTLAAAAALASEGKALRFLIGGRVVPRYAQAFARLLEAAPPGVEYLGPYEAGSIPDLYRRIHVACLVYPRSDWFRHITPTKFFDSLANGVPVIITDIGGLGDVVREQGCGLVIDENDPLGIARALARFMEDRDFLLQCARRAWRTSEELFNWRTMRERYVALMRQIHAV
jgi:glycosyltransferase involved in cell wall biosynthesis